MFLIGEISALSFVNIGLCNSAKKGEGAGVELRGVWAITIRFPASLVYIWKKWGQFNRLSSKNCCDSIMGVGCNISEELQVSEETFFVSIPRYYYSKLRMSEVEKVSYSTDVKMKRKRNPQREKVWCQIQFSSFLFPPQTSRKMANWGHKEIEFVYISSGFPLECCYLW